MGALAEKFKCPWLLSEMDGPPVEIINPYGDSLIVLVCEHASSRVPKRLQNLNLSDEQLSSHIGWDPDMVQ